MRSTKNLTVSNLPKTGDVFDYPYLWGWQDDRGETEGRKDRPSCVALIVPIAQDKHRIYILPLTTKEPEPGRHSIAIPQTERVRAGLGKDREQWLLLDEWNREVLETSYYFSDRKQRGSFSRRFMDQALIELRKLLASKSISTVGRE